MNVDQTLNTLLNGIPDPEVKQFTSNVLKVIPPKLWTIPAASRHHMHDERREYGNLLHTVRVLRICDVLADIADMNQRDRSELFSAAILHDVMKRGPWGDYPYTHDEHPGWMADFMEALPSEYEGKHRIAEYIRWHTGRWGKPPTEVVIEPQDALHIADAVAAHLGGILEEEL